VSRHRHGDWMQTYSGRQFWPLDPRPEDIVIEDIAHHLAMRVRYSGAASRFYSVAEHSVLVAVHVNPDYQREALLHDASEAYLGDMIRPLKTQPEFATFREVEDHLEAMIYERFGVVQTDASRAAVKRADNRILVDERKALMVEPPEPWHDTGPALGCRIVGCGWFEARSHFHRAFVELFGAST